MNSIDIAKGMNGMAIIGSLVMDFEKNISAVPFALAGDMDEQLYYGFYLTEYGTKRDFVEGDIFILGMVESIKHHLRRRVQGIFDAAARQEEMERAAKFERTRQELLQANKPHERGTVAEMAAKLGISKNEVRRHKAEGTLEALFVAKGL